MSESTKYKPKFTHLEHDTYSALFDKYCSKNSSKVHKLVSLKLFFTESYPY